MKISDDDRHDPAGRAARRLQQQEDQHDADVEVERLGIDGAIAELGALHR